jgi:hypothetical protein
VINGLRRAKKLEQNPVFSAFVSIAPILGEGLAILDLDRTKKAKSEGFNTASRTLWIFFFMSSGHAEQVQQKG